MKKRSLQFCIMLVLHLFMANHASAEIRNGYGYGKNMLSMKDSLTHFKEVLIGDKSLSASQRRQLKNSVCHLSRSIAYYEITEKLLFHFNLISPDLYHEINSITDRRGSPVDVYVKFVPQDGTMVKSWGTTYITQTQNDSNGASSEYGEHSVSIKIWLTSGALKVLAHEFGHVNYMVPNLETYMIYYREHYAEKISQFSLVGHHITDLSGRSAAAYAKVFQKDFTCFQKENKDKIDNPLAIREKIRRDVNGTKCKEDVLVVSECNS